ncbi:SDR family oxidoreductase [Mucilaginibacter daejeonensis]|uniref:SDR family NAD(P)-dependent oxidoreductase n=1 Tax=Mucilaginibacter daejeonensis TaxID=398049 RepID=UPI001D17B791|nr:SDR family oxidoreductase [Mucilaginibacter daejeonensis]UEG55088.1 SDR family oxidoreductase [Mucilaginibacter daejeonensis]
MDLNGKNYLVAGASSSIASSLITSLTEQGAKVYAISRKRSDNWPEGIEFLEADPTKDIADINSFLPEQLHGLVYCAGSINLKPFARVSDNDLMNDLEINALGAIRITRPVVRQLKAAGGSSVVFISSVAANTGMPYHTSIATAKGALEGFAIALAAELASQQIRVNVVAPSLTDTPLASNLLNSDDKKEASGKRHPLGRYGQPHDISSAIQFLLSDDSSWITGQTLAVDGGMGKLRMF